MAENLMTIKDVAEYLRLSEQTVQRYVLKKIIPFHKVQRSIRFRLAELEAWVDQGGVEGPGVAADDRDGDLFAGFEVEAGTAGAGADEGAQG
jgi:excisionase family DNA binding protein